MRIVTLQFAAASVLLSLASSAMAAGGNSGVIHFTGSIVEPPCTTSTTSTAGSKQRATIDMNLSCDHRSAFDVAFQQIGPNANSATTITLSRDGKPLGSEEAAYYRMAFKGQTNLRLTAKRSAAGGELSPVIMTISYL
ncbi:type 1 fimbrial protein [Collimonas silvisoli]|uniref:type 1 fimbrial protein n=1 Tax=Collimonas silvisoli TaxID=2825884 RepID=UPI001B8C1BB4|nr:type 1 fimbrial protein [Collimonas silvisoli]